MKRLNLLKCQLSKAHVVDNTQQFRDLVLAISPYKRDSTSFSFYQELIQLFNSERFLKPKSFKSMEDERRFTLDKVEDIISYFNSKGSIRIDELLNKLENFVILADVLTNYHPAIMVKLISVYTLYFHTIRNCGTDKHQVYLKRCLSGEDIGSFSLTEFDHGSDTRNIQTRAEYNHLTRKFVLTTPKKEDAKWWIAGLAQQANMTVVFARLIVQGEDYGINPFVVKIRDTINGKALTKVNLGDCGQKIGNNGVDNGFMTLDGLEIDYDQMLDRFCKINNKGSYESIYSNKDNRFAAVLAGLVEGRAILPVNSTGILLKGLMIAWKYAVERKQFKQSTLGVETEVVRYGLVNTGLINALAEVVCFRNYSFSIAKLWESLKANMSKFDFKSKEAHAIFSCIKPYVTSRIQKRLQELREIMGGNGYLFKCELGSLRDSNDVNNTWEGENKVLYQQTARFLISEFLNLKQGKQSSDKKYQDLINSSINQEVDELLKEFANNQSLASLHKIFKYRFSKSFFSASLILNFEFLSKNQEIWDDNQAYYIRDLVNQFAEFLIIDHLVLSSAFKEGTISGNLAKLFCANTLINDNIQYAWLECDTKIQKAFYVSLRNWSISICKEYGVPEFFQSFYSVMDYPHFGNPVLEKGIAGLSELIN